MAQITERKRRWKERGMLNPITLERLDKLKQDREAAIARYQQQKEEERHKLTRLIPTKVTNNNEQEEALSWLT